MAGGNSNNLARINSSGVSLGNISLSFSPGDLVMNPVDGTLWISGNSDSIVRHVKTDGTLLGSFPVALPNFFYGLGLAPDNQSLYVTSTSATLMRRYDFSGNPLSSFTIPNGTVPGTLTVVPAIVPEPASTATLLGGCALLTSRRRRGA